jgi:RHS repeat-associated protein
VSGSGARAHAIDVDGDGREDLVWADLTGFAGGDAVRYRLRVPGGAFSGTVGTLVGPLPVNEKLESGIFGPAGQRDPYDVPDFNGDGRNDIVYRHSRREFDFESQTYTHYYSIRALVPGGWTFETSTGGVNSTPQIADFNGDGKTDLLYYNGANWRYQFSRGTSFGASNVGPSILPYLADWVILDWDGDGYDDVLVPHTSSGTWHLMRSTGEALLNPVPTGMPWTSGALAVGDTNGDGLDDFTYTVGTSFRFRTRAGAYPDLLLTATDGFDNAATFSYAPITNASYYAKHADAAFPEQDYQGGLYVVSSLLAPDGIGGTYTSSFFYYGARIHLQGRGFEGFWSRRAHDSRTGLFAYDYHRRDFPFIGLTFQADILQPNNATLIRRTQRTPGYHSYSSGYEVRYFPHVTQETTSEYEVGGTYNSAQKRTVSTSYAFDSQSGALYDRTTTLSEPSTANGVQAGASYVQRIYHPSLFTDIANWCLGRPASTQLINSHSLHGGTAQTRTVGRSWNGAKCRPTQIQIEPGDTLWQVTVDVGYDAFGNPNSETLTGIDMPARTTTLNWGTTGQFPVSMTNALSQTTQFGWDLARGAKTSETDPNGIAISWQYDPYGRVTREDRPDGTWTQRTYNDCAASGCQGSQNRMIVIAAQGSGSTTIRDTWTYLDAFERPIVTSAKMLTGAYNRVDRQYDAMGRLFRESAPCWWASCSTQFWTTYSYDLLDRPTQVSRPTSDSDPTPAITTLYHEGLTTRTVDPQARQRTQIVNVLGRTARSVDHTGYYQSFDFDAFGSLVRVQDSLLATLLSATYNVRGMQMTATDIDRGAWSYGYNALGERTSHTDANLATTIYTYDALSRPLMRQMPEGTGSITSLFTWGQFADNTPTAKHVGRLKQMQISGTGVSAYSETYAYDSIGRPSQTTYNDGTNHVFDFAYDTTTGLLRDVTYPVSTEAFRLQARYEYQNGFLKRVRNFNNNLTFWEAQETDARGLLTRETLGDDPNGYVFDTVSSFDQVTGLLESRQATYTSDELVGTAIENHSYFWDNVGNLLQRQDNRQGLTENFYYDALYRLDYSTLNATQNLDLAYDARGNITSKSGVGTYAYHPTKLHAVASVNTGSGTLSYSYDANGQMTNRNGTTISWYASNLPKSVTKDASNSSSFQYTPDGRRWRHTYVTAGSTYTTSYFGSYMEKVLEPGGVTSWKHFILAGGEAVTVYIRKGGAKDRYLLVKDHLGSPTAMVHARDGLYLRESASAYGSRRGTNWTGTPSAGDLTKMNTVTRRGFTFHEHLDSTDPVHMNGRVYDPLLGRFASGDPFTAPATDTQSWNRYSYVINRPLSFSDPSGFLRRPWILPPDALAEIWSTAIERLATRDSGGGGGGGNQSSDGGGVGSPPGAEYGDEAEEPTTVIPLQPQGQQSQGLPEIVVVAYQGQFHDELVAQLAEAMRATGADVVTELPLCFEGGGCARIDIFGRDPTGNELFALEVKTGLNPRFTPGQLAVYPHLRRGGLVVSPDPRIVRFGWPTGVPLPSINGILLYQKDERSPPVIVPIP